MQRDNLSDSKCAICGKERGQHSTSSGYGVCQMYPVFVSERAMFERLAKSATEQKG